MPHWAGGSLVKGSCLTRPGRHMASQTPMRLSGAVPATMKSFAVSMAPMLSVPARYTLPSASSPAITGCTKYGPNLRMMRQM